MGRGQRARRESGCVCCAPLRAPRLRLVPARSPPVLPSPTPRAGKLLAHLLLSGAHGDRPVRLVAHGMGARLVFHCLLELCRQGARGVVQHAVLMGCPVRAGQAGCAAGRGRRGLERPWAGPRCTAAAGPCLAPPCLPPQVGTEELRWRMARRAVAGRLLNCYTRKDWLLGVMAGGSSGWMRATAGLVPIEVPGVENVNLTNLVR